MKRLVTLWLLLALCLTAALALAYAEYGRRARPMRAKRLLLCGVLAGGIATIKYTLLGAMVGLCAVEGALALKEGGAPRALKSAGVFLAGMAIPILPWVIYFAANGALRDAYTAYIYNYVFLYGGEAASWGQRLGELARYVQKNALWAVPAALGLAALAADRGETAAVRLCVAAMAAGQFAAVFFVGRVWAYSLLALADRLYTKWESSGTSMTFPAWLDAQQVSMKNLSETAEEPDTDTTDESQTTEAPEDVPDGQESEGQVSGNSIWEIIGTAVRENPIIVWSIVAVVAALVIVGAVRRYHKVKRDERDDNGAE